MEKFTIGLMLGAIGGAYAVANSYKMRTLVRKGQEEIKERLDEMLDEKLKAVENGGSVFPCKKEKEEEAETEKPDDGKKKKKK